MHFWSNKIVVSIYELGTNLPKSLKNLDVLSKNGTQISSHSILQKYLHVCLKSFIVPLIFTMFYHFFRFLIELLLKLSKIWGPYRQKSSSLLCNMWPARCSRLTQRETNHFTLPRKNMNLPYSIQKLAKTWIYLTPYVRSDRIFDSRPFMNNKIFLKKLS